VTHDATTPLTRGDTVLLALDLWEHAYYLDHQNRRAAYVTGFLEELVSWEFANSMLAGLTRVPDGAAQWTRRPAGVRAERGAAGMPPPRA